MRRSRLQSSTGILLELLALSSIAALIACGGGGSGTTTTPPPAISVTLAGAPASLLTNATADLIATVANDSANAGVKWSVTCGRSGACGAFTNPTATTATYTAPAAVPTMNAVLFRRQAFCRR